MRKRSRIRKEGRERGEEGREMEQDGGNKGEGESGRMKEDGTE